MSDDTNLSDAGAESAETGDLHAATAGGHAGDGAPPPVQHSRRMRIRRGLVRVRRFVRRTFWGLVVVVLALIALASQTGRGQDIVLRTVLGEVRSSLAGELAIEGIRSGTLLTGATLRGVSLVAADGRPFLRADSVVVRYSLWAAITGGSPIRSTTLHGADVIVSQYREDQEVNVALLAAPGDSASSARGSRPTRLGHFAIRRGRARIVSPAESPEKADGVGPGGEPVRELTFEGLDLDVENTLLVPGGSVLLEADLASFSSTIGILEEPVRVREVFGDLTFGEGGIRIVDAAFRLPNTLLDGSLVVGPEVPGAPWIFRTDLRTRRWGDLDDLAWIDPRVPQGRFEGAASVRVDGSVDIGLEEFRVQLEASDVVFDGQARFTDLMTLDDMRVVASPVTLERLEPWLDREIPVDGWLSGDGRFSGTLDDLTGSGRMTLVPTGFGGSPTTMVFEGRLRRGEDGGAQGFRARLDPLNYGVLGAFWPQLPWAGIGSATVELDGNVYQGLQIDADLIHRSPSSDSSRVEARGYVWRGADAGSWITDLTLDLRPLSVGLFASLAPRLGLEGGVTGPARVEGRLSDLRVAGDLVTSFGRVEIDSRINLRAPATDYRFAVAADSFPLSRLSDRLPPLTRWSGALTVEGSGFSLDSADVGLTVSAHRSRIGSLRIDTLSAEARISEGVLATQWLEATIGGIDVTGRGTLGLQPGRWGSSNLEFAGPSLVGLRPLVMGVPDTVLVQDGLSELDRELLRVQGVDPDTLPSERDIRLDGRVSGVATVSGDIDALDVGMIVDVMGGAYRQNSVDSARIAFTATELPTTQGAWGIGATARGIAWEGREFEHGGFEVDMFAREGGGRVEVVRREGEEYMARGSFALDSIGGMVLLDAGTIRLDDQLWRVARAGPIAWRSGGVSVDSVEVVRAGPDPMRVVVDGDLRRNGQSDFRLSMEGLHVEQLVHMAQLQGVSIAGHVDADLTVRGTSEAPSISGAFSVLGPRYGAMQLTRLDGSIEYADRLARVSVDGWDTTRRVVTGAGTIPLDLAVVAVERRVLDAPMDVELSTDSLDAAIALSYLTTLDGVLGTVSGDVRIRGTPLRPEPEGTITLRNAAWSIEAIGVRHTGVSGRLDLRPDRTVDVLLEARGPGQSRVTGTVLLEPVRDPELDLDFEFTRFLAVSRPDIEGYVSGEFELTGTYTRPLAEGALRVDEGTINVDELQRAASVVDLSDPFLFDVGLAVDTTALVSQPLFAGLRNPFFDNLRVDVDLLVPRGTWLRSIDTNVEMSGELLMVYDRSAGDFVLIGELEAIRGSHLVLGRTFALQGGTVSFIGRPGLNPDLDIQATTRIRSPNEAPLVVDARVTGTLVQPIVTLSSEAGLAEEDLISYLVFGQPSGALGGSAGATGRIQDLNAVTSVGQAGLTFVGGAFANQLGSALAREFTLDYVSIQQGGGARTLGTSLVAEAFGQVELGRYVGDRVFVILVLRPFDAGPGEQNNVAGLRVELSLTDDYNVELFAEDRFLRSGSSGLRTTALIGNEDIVGVFLFREWGYGSSNSGGR